MSAPRKNQYAKGHGYGRPAKYTDPEVMRNKLDEYFQRVEEAKTIPSIAGITLHLGFSSKSTLYKYRRKQDFSHCIKRALLYVEYYWELQLSGPNCRTAIWMLKKFGWRG